MKNYTKIARDYANKVIKAKTGVGKLEKLMVQRFIDDLRYQAKVNAEFYYSAKHTHLVCGFVERLPHVKGHFGGSKITLVPFQVFWLANIYGFRWIDGGSPNPETDGRRFTDTYIEVGRGNAKTTLMAALALYGLVGEGEVAPEIICAATSGKQAKLIFEMAQDMARGTGDFREYYEVEVWSESIISHRKGTGRITAINSKSSTQDGLIPFYVFIDELHAHQNNKLINVLHSARGKCKNPLTWKITTAGDNTIGPCFQEREMAVKILQGKIKRSNFSLRYFAAIYTIDPEDNRFSVNTWKKANPIWAYNEPLREEIKTHAQKAQAQSSLEPEFFTKRLNIWLQGTASWIMPGDWKACEDKSLSIDSFKGEDCWIGYDLSSRSDITAVVILFLKDEVYYPFLFAYLPEDYVEGKVAEGLPFYREWEKQGYLTTTQGNYIDTRKIQADIEALVDKFKVIKILHDQFVGASHIASNLIEKGVEVEELPKSAKNLTVPCIDFEGRVLTRELIRHDGNPILSWNVLNTHVERRKNKSLFPCKESPNSKNKIDGLDALILAIAAVMETEEATSVSIMESEDFSWS